MGTLGEEFAQAFAAKDRERLEALLAPGVDFRALTPDRVWEAGTAAAVIEEVLCSWVDESDEVEGVLSISSGRVGDREHVSYRFLMRNASGLSEMEQQAYYVPDDEGRIAWMRVLCSGFRPAAPPREERSGAGSRLAP